MDDEITIIGGGIAGVSAAYHLSTRTDVPITVYERGAAGTATTAKSTAVFRVMDDPLLAPMKRYGLRVYNRFLAAPRTNSAFELIGRLEVATGEEGARSYAGPIR